MKFKFWDKILEKIPKKYLIKLQEKIYLFFRI